MIFDAPPYIFFEPNLRIDSYRLSVIMISMRIFVSGMDLVLIA